MSASLEPGLAFTQQFLEARAVAETIPRRTEKKLVAGDESLDLQQALDFGPQ
jgi:hypothetical protein